MSNQPDDVRKAIEFFNSEHDDSGLIEYGRVLVRHIAEREPFTFAEDVSLSSIAKHCRKRLADGDDDPLVDIVASSFPRLLGEISRLQSILSRLPMSRICSAHREPGNYECRTCYPMLEPVTQTQANGE